MSALDPDPDQDVWLAPPLGTRGEIDLNHPDSLEELLIYLDSLGWAIRRRGLPW